MEGKTGSQPDGGDQIAKDIAASVADVKKLLEANKNLTVAYLAMRVDSTEQSLRAHLRNINRVEAKLAKVLADVETTTARIEKASALYSEMKIRMDNAENRLDDLEAKGTA